MALTRDTSEMRWPWGGDLQRLLVPRVDTQGASHSRRTADTCPWWWGPGAEGAGDGDEVRGR